MSHSPLPSAITTQNAATLAETLRALDTTKPQTLDATHTEVITTAGVQLLIALQKTLQQSGSALSVKGQGPAFRSAFTDLGFTAIAEGE
jgi:anti-anti-sigma regulatory factor